MQTNPIGENIRALRERKAWTQEHLAGAARISPRTVQRAEEGVMSAETKTAIAGALNVPVESLAERAKPHWPAITPVLVYEDSKKAFEWLQKVFGFSAREKITGVDGQVVHGELTLGEGVIMIGHVGDSPSSSPRWASPKSLAGRGTQFLYVMIRDVDAHYAKAKKAGANIVTEMEESYGQRRYRVLDLEGHEWCFGSEVAS
jgi:uncharacterized glyoxalase superfamily protein PhnB/DNA-binding XRE family transcriptional regulator